MRKRASGVNETGVRDGMAMVGEGGSCEKDLPETGRKSYGRNDSRKRSLDVRSGSQGWSEEEARVLPVGLMLMRLGK